MNNHHFAKIYQTRSHRQNPYEDHNKKERSHKRHRTERLRIGCERGKFISQKEMSKVDLHKK